MAAKGLQIGAIQIATVDGIEDQELQSMKLEHVLSINKSLGTCRLLVFFFEKIRSAQYCFYGL